MWYLRTGGRQRLETNSNGKRGEKTEEERMVEERENGLHSLQQLFENKEDKNITEMQDLDLNLRRDCFLAP